MKLQRLHLYSLLGAFTLCWSLTIATARDNPLTERQAIEQFILSHLRSIQPKWSQSHRDRFATEIAKYLMDNIPKEQRETLLAEFKSALPWRLKFMPQMILVPSMLDLEIERFKWSIKQWLRRGPVNPDAQRKIETQIDEFIKWCIATALEKHPELNPNLLRRYAQSLLARLKESARNPLSTSLKQPLDKSQIERAKDVYLHLLSQPLAEVPPGMPKERRITQYMGRIAGIGRPAEPRPCSILSRRVYQELLGWCVKQSKENRAKILSRACTSAVESLESMEWMVYGISLLNHLLRGGDPTHLPAW
ncbi:MAG TPA: hypothetical protein EYP10_06745 [Armatimonadetes bacterium]|nr:hypothetical protein [Armatimonadota bacterium]